MPPRRTEPRAGGDGRAARSRLPQRRTVDDDSDVGSGAGSDAEDVSGDEGLDEWDEDAEDGAAAAMDEDEGDGEEEDDDDSADATPPELSEDELARHPLFRPVTIHVRRYPVKEVYLDNLLEAFPTLQASSHIGRLLAQTQKKFQTSVHMAQYARCAALAAASACQLRLIRRWGWGTGWTAAEPNGRGRGATRRPSPSLTRTPTTARTAATCAPSPR